MSNIVIKLSVLAAAALPLCQPTAAYADAPGMVQESRSVSIAGVDLASSDGMALLNMRIAQAARTICGRKQGADLVASMAQRKCFAGAMKSTTSQVELAIANMRNERYAAASGQVAVVSIKP